MRQRVILYFNNDNIYIFLSEINLIWSRNLFEEFDFFLMTYVFCCTLINSLRNKKKTKNTFLRIYIFPSLTIYKYSSRIYDLHTLLLTFMRLEATLVKTCHFLFVMMLLSIQIFLRWRNFPILMIVAFGQAILVSRILEIGHLGIFC